MAVRTKDVNKELEIIDQAAKISSEDAVNVKVVLMKNMLKALGLLVKLFRDYRNNQVLIMRAQGIKLMTEENDEKNDNE